MIVSQAPGSCREAEVAVLGEDDVLGSEAELEVFVAVGDAVVHFESEDVVEIGDPDSDRVRFVTEVSQTAADDLTLTVPENSDRFI